MKKLFLAAVAALSLNFAVPVQALPGFTNLDDEAEAGGFDVVAKVTSQPLDWSLCEQETGDGYRLKLSPAGIELSLAQGKKITRLNGVAKPVVPGVLVIQRRGPTFRVIADRRILFEADDDTFADGTVGYRGPVGDPKLQPSDDIAFDDDFMRLASDVATADAGNDPRRGVTITSVRTEEKTWASAVGSWNTTGLTENPAALVAQSANPFVFKSGAKGDNLAIAGKAFWDNYSAEVSVKPEGATAIGIVIYAQDAKNYLIFHMAAEGPAQLRAVIDGQVRVLDENKATYDQHQWYRIRLSASNGHLRAAIDDAEILSARTGLFGRGQVGLFSSNPTAEAHAVFDDVQVRSLADFSEDFNNLVPGRWKSVVGQMQTVKGVMKPQGAQGAFAVLGDKVWEDYTAVTEADMPAGAAVGVVLHHSTGEGTYLFRLAGSKSSLPYAGTAQIVKMGAGKTTVLDEVKVGAKFDAKLTEWRFSCERGYLKVETEGVRVLDAFDDSLGAGRPGLFAMADAKTKAVPGFVGFEVDFLNIRPTWATVPELYTTGPQPETMGDWSTPEGAWSPLRPIAGANATGETNAVRTLWHKGAFWGDSTVRFRLPALTGTALSLNFGESNRSALSLSLKTSGNLLQGSLTRLAVSGENTNLTQGEVILEGKLDGQGVEVARRGRFVIVRAGETGMKLLVAKVG